MRSHCALYVDVGYLLSSAATRVTGTSLRNGIHVEYRPLVESLIRQAEEISDLPVLRVHWYDSAKDGVPDAQQERIGELPKVKLRLGRFGLDRQQKGVDLRIGLDLVAHARNNSADVFILVSGDDDLTEAVEESQAHGVQVILLAVPNAAGKPHGVSRHLVRAVDDLQSVAAANIDKAVTRKELPKPAPPAQAPTPKPASPSAAPHRPVPGDLAGTSRKPTPIPVSRLAYSGATGRTAHVAPGYEEPDANDEQIDSVATKVVVSFRQSASPESIYELDRGRPSIPRDIDRALLLDLSDTLDVYDLSDAVRVRLRARFWDKYDELGKTSP